MALAELLGWSFVDADARICDLHAQVFDEPGCRGSHSARSIHATHGARYFRSLEREALGSVVADISGKTAVLSLGGGALLQQRNRALLRREQKAGRMVLVHIRCAKQEAYRRIMRQGIPAMLDARKPRQSFVALWHERMPAYERLADVTVWNRSTARRCALRLRRDLDAKGITLLMEGSKRGV
ncbi:hypothetical protein AUJ68_04460 [Candidatus Woesearchaeota archaeon CG1_02_57_44]|nr:MAG: hypothetical protein AUJ68_04460 [Candidatus Woesearchaeota archaeon CG1_02_57_44]